jgi:hypothetical protein
MLLIMNNIISMNLKFSPMGNALMGYRVSRYGATRDPESRPAMILFSDGMDTISMHGPNDVIEAAENLQSPIYSVNSRPAKSGAGRGEGMLQYLSSNTGGLSFAPGNNVEQVLRTVLDDLHSGYVLTYVLPEQTGGQHEVQVLATTDPRLEFRARHAYSDAE